MSTWYVAPHEPLETLDDGLWRVVGTVPGLPGVTLHHRVMTIARRGDGQLVLHSVVACDEVTMAAIEALGPIGFILVPGKNHRLDVAGFAARYPDATVLTPTGAREHVAAVAPVDGTYDDFPPDPSVRLALIDGMGDAEGAMWVFGDKGVTLVLNDVVFDTDVPEGAGAWLLSQMLGTAPGPRVSRVIRWREVDDPAALRAHLLRLADTPGLNRLIVSHDRLEDGRAAAQALKAAAASLA